MNESGISPTKRDYLGFDPASILPFVCWLDEEAKPLVVTTDNIRAIFEKIRSQQKEAIEAVPIAWTPVPLGQEDYDFAVANGYGPLVCLSEGLGELPTAPPMAIQGRDTIKSDETTI